MTTTYIGNYYEKSDEFERTYYYTPQYLGGSTNGIKYELIQHIINTLPTILEVHRGLDKASQILEGYKVYWI